MFAVRIKKISSTKNLLRDQVMCVTENILFYFIIFFHKNALMHLSNIS